jgi:exopolyphosphatase/guanosine-5'-triphosphate,3'-diphosphate pyrophosphatase
VRIAAVDLGSNSFHLLVAEVRPDGAFESLIREKEMLRLGDVVSREGEITPEAADAAVRTMRRFRKLAEAAGAVEMLARATSALRSAQNGDEVLDRIASEAGVEVDVIDGIDEARLIFLAIRAGVMIDPGPALCLDVGGGSVELMVGDASGMLWAASERIGVARMSAQYVTSDPISKGDLRRLRDRYVDVLGPHAVTVARFEPKMAIGSSGTLEDLAHMVAERRDEVVPRSLNQLTVSRPEFLALHEELVASTSAERRKMKGLDAKRVDLIVAGSVLLSVAMGLFDVEELTISEWALREGIVLDAIGRHEPGDWSDDPRAIRRSSVMELARRCSWPEQHSRHVATLALQLFDLTCEIHGLSDEDRELLEYAALLHDIGEHVAHEDHDKHAAYLVSHGNLRGFPPDEVTLLAALVRWHRRGDPKPSDELVGELDADARDRVRKLVALLRIADGLDRSRKQVVSEIAARVSPSMVLLRLAARSDPELELWGARRKRQLFERVFDRELEVTAHPSGAGLHNV